MKHNFTVIEEQDCPLAVAVGAYLDCEHYVHLHKSIMTKLDIVKVDGRKVTFQQGLQWMKFLKITQTFTMEYFPPGHFRSFDLKSSPWWIPSVHNFIKILIDVRYTKHPERDTTNMQFDVEMDMPFWLYPFRGILQNILEKMHHLKDQEDLDAIHRRAKLFGRDNINAYTVEHQFLLHKDDYVAHFGTGAKTAAATATATDTVPVYR